MSTSEGGRLSLNSVYATLSVSIYLIYEWLMNEWYLFHHLSYAFQSWKTKLRLRVWSTKRKCSVRLLSKLLSVTYVTDTFIYWLRRVNNNSQSMTDWVTLSLSSSWRDGLTDHSQSVSHSYFPRLDINLNSTVSRIWIGSTDWVTNPVRRKTGSNSHHWFEQVKFIDTKINTQ